MCQKQDPKDHKQLVTKDRYIEYWNFEREEHEVLLINIGMMDMFQSISHNI